MLMESDMEMYASCSLTGDSMIQLHSADITVLVQQLSVGRSEGTNNDYTHCKEKKVSSLTKKKTPAVSYFPTSFCGEKLPEGPKDTQ